MTTLTTLVRPLDWRPLRWTAYGTALFLYLTVNVVLFSGLYGWALAGLPSTDWSNISNLPANPYDNGAFRWSPPAAWVWSGLIEPLGLQGWRVLHLAALLLLPWPVALLALVSAPFWFDVANGNILTFALVAAWHALNGNRIGIVAFVVLAVLVPRPLMIPVLITLLWHEPAAQRLFALAAVGVLVLSLATGLADDFIIRMTATPSAELAADYNYGPSRLIGWAWIPIGAVLAAVLTWRGRIGWASLAISPYLIHYYLLFGLLELRKSDLGHTDVHRNLRGSPTRAAVGNGTDR